MSSSSGNKQFGLLIPKKSGSATTIVSKHSAFGDDSDSDQSGSDPSKRSFKRETTLQLTTKRQTKWDMQKALDQDATVYQYDEVYDDMEAAKKSKLGLDKGKERKPKYIQKLLVTAERRKLENERRIERQVQKEREQEGDEFKDKETFVTSAYKKKLEEIAKLDAEQRRQDMLEEIGDVTKQEDISGFYRHLYETTMSPKKETTPPPVPLVEKPAQERHYRKRKSSDASQDGESQQDADTSSSESASSNSSDDDSNQSEEDQSGDDGSDKPVGEEVSVSKTSNTENPAVVSMNGTAETASQPRLLDSSSNVELSPPINIWEKRTVGAVFEAARQRYLIRKGAMTYAC